MSDDNTTHICFSEDRNNACSLFNHQNKINIKPLIVTKKQNSKTAGFYRKINHGKLHWSQQLFANSTPKLDIFDRIEVILERNTIVVFEIRSPYAEILIGSHELADICLDNCKIDPFQAKIIYRNGQFQVVDFGEKPIIYLGSKKLQRNVPSEFCSSLKLYLMAFTIRTVSPKKRINSQKTRHFNSALHSEIQFPSTRKNNSINETKAQFSTKPSPVQLWNKSTQELEVIDVIEETHDVKTFRLSGINPTLFTYLPGQFVTLLLTINGKPVKRSYSMSSSPSRPHTLDLTVKRVPGGLVSNWLCDQVKTGDRLTVKGPAGRFSCEHGSAKKLLLIGAGSGITPLMSMCRWHFDRASAIDTKVLFSFRNLDDVIFKKELELMSASSKTVDIAVTLTQQTEHKDDLARYSGRIDQEMIETFTSDLHDREIYLCGPQQFMDVVKQLLKSLNFPMQQLHCESFGDSSNQKNLLTRKKEIVNNTVNKAPSSELQHQVTFSQSNIVIHTDEQTNLLELAEQSRIEIDYNCRTGSCAECMIQCMSGDVVMTDECEIEDHEREQGWIFSCCTFVRSDVVINA